MVSNVIYCEFEKVGNACRNQLKYKGKKEVCGPDRALFEKGFQYRNHLVEVVFLCRKFVELVTFFGDFIMMS